MSRSGYSDSCDGWQLIMWRGAVKKAIDGKRGQAFLEEMLIALDALPDKKLIKDDLVTPQGEVCAIGSVLQARGVDTTELDIYCPENIAAVVGIAPALVQDIEFINDEAHDYYGRLTDERRFEIVRNWVVSQIKEVAS